MHRIHLERAGAAVVCRPKRVGVAVVYWFILPVQLHLVHVASAAREIIGNLALELVSVPVGPFHFREEVRRSGEGCFSEGMMYGPRSFRTCRLTCDDLAPL